MLYPNSCSTDTQADPWLAKAHPTSNPACRSPPNRRLVGSLDRKEPTSAERKDHAKEAAHSGGLFDLRDFVPKTRYTNGLSSSSTKKSSGVGCGRSSSTGSGSVGSASVANLTLR